MQIVIRFSLGFFISSFCFRQNNVWNLPPLFLRPLCKGSFPLPLATSRLALLNSLRQLYPSVCLFGLLSLWFSVGWSSTELRIRRTTLSDYWLKPLWWPRVLPSSSDPFCSLEIDGDFFGGCHSMDSLQRCYMPTRNTSVAFAFSHSDVPWRFPNDDNNGVLKARVLLVLGLGFSGPFQAHGLPREFVGFFYMIYFLMKNKCLL